MELSSHLRMMEFFCIELREEAGVLGSNDIPLPLHCIRYDGIYVLLDSALLCYIDMQTSQYSQNNTRSQTRGKDYKGWY